MHSYFRSKGYRALINAALFNGIGNSLFNIVFIIYAGSLSFKTLAVSLASFVVYIPQIINVFLGYYADNTHHKYEWMVSSRLIQFGLFMMLAFLIGMHESLWIFGILLAINVSSDCLGMFASGLELPYFRHLVPDNELNDAMGFEMATDTTLQLAFQGIGSVAIVWLNYNYGLFGVINALTFSVAALIIWTRKSIFQKIDPQLSVNQPDADMHKPEPIFKSMRTTAKFMFSKKILVLILSFAFAMNTFFSAMNGMINVSLLHNHNLWFGNYGTTVALVSIATSVGTVLGSLISRDFLAHTKFSTMITYVCFMLVVLAGYFVTGKSILLITILSFTSGYVLGKLNPRVSALVIRIIPDDRLGASMGFVNMAVLIGAPVGSAFFLTIANIGSRGITYSWIIFGICALLLGIAGVIAGIKVDESEEDVSAKSDLAQSK
ncbi:MFS transporter [Lentilactobacillus kefiri]|uniref:Transportation permease, UpsA n=2 Tax=Lentilactobacillus kefiri TaxID=33962 RepID=A0A8E1RKE6_LENKE|nr:MFS transporter [Lentilactobacillus kefiri]KRL71719.1 transportation permease, UpsA [Lentilactobacillus parakefiri DSM 10551]KRM53404.1 transportation permease, UpsA [Lentilactobacillus kefiri DSM 20587 = JCM 5818]MCJ2161731.1 MFS transporter [Lentilactobacillus kefiri]MDH5108447.1 MFS transporter [Lentilactobacillus kefiri]MDM7492908.1 MFS transporter [Lentilactobacillus kefiri]